MTRRVEYVGSVVNAAARITALAHGGQVLVSQQRAGPAGDKTDTIGRLEKLAELLDVTQAVQYSW